MTRFIDTMYIDQNIKLKDQSNFKGNKIFDGSTNKNDL